MKYWFEVPPERDEVMKAILPSIEKQLEVKFVPFKTANKRIYRRGFIRPRGDGFGHMVYRVLNSENRVEVSYSHRCAESVMFRDECGGKWDQGRGVWYTSIITMVVKWLDEHGYKKVEA